MNTIVEPAFGIIPLDLIRESKTNPRKRFSETALGELAESINRSGVGQPILVRPLANEDGEPAHRVEIVAGARRYRASLLAGKDSIPAIVRDMSDAEVLEFQLVENLQREDVHPIEEAEGYERMMSELHLNADQVAEKVGKSRSYIYGRLKLCALTPDAREAFYDGKLSASTALLIARIPVPELQVRAIKDVCGRNGGEPMSYRTAQNHISHNFTLHLSKAPWSIDDAELLPGAGSCAACPKRCGNQPEIYPDAHPDVCTDPDCFDQKRKASYARIETTAASDGIPIFDYESTEGKNLRTSADHSLDYEQLYSMDREKSGSQRYQRLDEVLSHDQLPPTVAFLRLSDGSLTGVYLKTAMQAALERACICYTEAEQAEIDRQNEQSEEPETAEQIAKRAQKAAEAEARNRRADEETALRLETYRRIRSKNNGITDAALRYIAKTFLSEYPVLTELSEFYPDGCDHEAITKMIDTASRPTVECMLLDLCTSFLISVATWEIDRTNGRDDEYQELAELASAHGIDIEQVRAELYPPAPPAEPEDQAKQPEPTEEHADPAAAADPAEPAKDSHEPLAIGDTVRIKDGLKGPNGKARKCCGRTGTISSAVDGAYVVTVGKSNHAQLTRDDLEKVQPAAEPQEEAKPAAPADAYANSAWPFPRRGS
ncbi:MAG: ParB/RepB/Spo0J family partition protein [Burkholderiaceae bacterium]